MESKAQTTRNYSDNSMIQTNSFNQKVEIIGDDED